MHRFIVTNFFKKQLKRLTKKDAQLKEHFKKVLINFRKEIAVSIGNNVYKLRIQGLGKGKSGGYRLYIFVLEIKGILCPIFIYPKNEKENLSLKELNIALEKTKEEMEKLL
ncbi:MAG: type II toxin-antitoxin system RelE/ParE family toxin [Candidatus Peregrinibacteria bacterium]|nr:type II toxin-antitoxin system RelE/ParE family toxin [Candidatus Peregrinibacteria bacterium]